MSNFDAIKLSVEASMPNNTVLFDDKGMPSVMVKIPKFKISNVIVGGSETTHRFRAMLFRMLPKPFKICVTGLLRFRAMLFRMLPKLDKIRSG